MRISIARRDSALYRTCVQTARQKFASVYGADINPSPESFVVLEEDEGTAPNGMPLAFLSLTYPDTGQSLVKHYLGQSIVDAITAILPDAQDIEIHDIVELGSMVSTRPAAGIALMKALPGLMSCNAKIALFTATRSLIKILNRTGIEFIPLVEATEQALPASERGKWGSYYESDPVTCYADIREFQAEIPNDLNNVYQLPLILAKKVKVAALCVVSRMLFSLPLIRTKFLLSRCRIPVTIPIFSPTDRFGTGSFASTKR